MLLEWDQLCLDEFFQIARNMAGSGQGIGISSPCDELKTLESLLTLYPTLFPCSVAVALKNMPPGLYTYRTPIFGAAIIQTSFPLYTGE